MAELNGEALIRKSLFDKIRSMKNPNAPSAEEEAGLATDQSTLLSYANSRKSDSLTQTESNLAAEYKRRKAREKPGAGPGKNPCYGSIGTADCK